MNDKIQRAYHSSKNIYDSLLTQGNIFSKLYMKLFWSGTDDNVIAREILNYIPDHFGGVLLDVPVGTAVFTYKKWAGLSGARIICLDYSEDMIEQANERLKDCDHVTCLQGDVGKLPVEDESCDIVISMNGFHAFPDKKRAFEEIWRVLKTGGKFIACFYIKDESGLTDWLVKSILSKKGWFSPPFLSKKEVEEKLNQKYKSVDLKSDGSMVYFQCIK